MQRFFHVKALTYIYMYSRIIYKYECLPWFPLSIGLCVIVAVEDALAKQDTKSTEFFSVVENLFTFSVVNNLEWSLVIFVVLMLIVGNILLVALLVGDCNDEELHAGNISP